MSPALRLLVFALALGLGVFLNGAARDQPASAVQSCDSSYPTICLPVGLGITCYDIGYPIPVGHGPGQNDPYFLDPDYDGVGCEEF